MNALSLRRATVSGTILSVTSAEDALRQSIDRLNPRAEDLIAEIERDIKRQRGADLHVACRAGNYTPEVVAAVADLYRMNGWRVDTRHPYWMTLTY